VPRRARGRQIGLLAQLRTDAFSYAPLEATVGPAELMLLTIYFVPAIIGFARHHRQKWPIMVIDLFLGWTLIGWVVALAMSVSATTARSVNP
jgi:hypothetical protein